MSRSDITAIRYLDTQSQATLSDVASSLSEFGIWEGTGSTIREVSKCIVALSSDYYWESDADHRISQVSCSESSRQKRASMFLLGKTRWESGAVPLTSSWDEHKRVIDAHKPFRDFLLKHPEQDGSIRYISVSGMPRFGSDGTFAGYLGVSRDVTRDVQLNVISNLEIAIMQLLAGAEYLDAVHATLRLVCKKLDFSKGRYWEAGNEIRALRLVDDTRSVDRSARNNPADAPRASDIKPSSMVNRAFSTGKTVFATLRRTQPPEDPGDETQKAVAVPLCGHGGMFGVLEFRAARLDYPKSRFGKFLSHLSAQITIAHDRHEATENLQESERRFASTFELAAIGICHVEPSGRVVHVNQRLIDMLGYSREELLGKTVADLSHPDDLNHTKGLITSLEKREVDHFEVEKRYIRKDGQFIWVRIKTVMKWGEHGEPLYHISVVEDISVRKQAEEKIEHMATHDELTGLPNRAQFNDLVRRAILSASDSQRHSCAVLFVDLDRFKMVNDSFGHHVGDELLRTVATRIQGAIRASDRVGRFGGDEFVVLLDKIEDAANAENVARKILHAVSEPLKLQRHECRVTASIGIAVYPDDGGDAESLIRNSDVAMYSAKQSGRNDLEKFSVDLTPTAINKIRLETQLQHALARNEFRILYQPRVEARSGKIKGAEALIRWWNAELGTIPPVQFIPVAEDSGLIIPIGSWLLRAACLQHRAWCDRKLGPISVSVNLSPKQFADPSLLDTVRESLDQAGMEAQYLELEITEGMLMSHLDRAMDTAMKLRDLGVGLAIDDFGTGYSSMMQLKRFPFDTLKIDRSFVRDLPDNREDRAITEAIIAMGRTLGVTVVAEGIETEAQCDLLRELRCDEFQGYLFGKPGHPNELAALLGRSG